MRPRLPSLILLLTVVFGSLLFPVAQAQDSAVGLLKQMIAIAADNGGLGRTAELNALKEQIEALPKPARGDRKTARTANDAGLAALNAGQFEQAKKHFLSAAQTDPADIEIAGNLGFAALNAGDFKQAMKALSAALALAPGRSSAWVTLAEYFAVQGQQQQAVACYALIYHFSKDQDKTRSFLQKWAAASENPKVRQAMQQALQLSLISGGVEEEETVADASAEDSLDAPLPPTAPAPRSLSPAAPVPPPIAAAPVTPPPIAAAPVTPPVATSPIPASLLPPASPKPDVIVAPPASNTDAAAGSGKDDIVEVVAQGMGTDQPSALNNAYSNAVQQALGLYVDAETMVQNDQIVRDQILTYSKGFIQKVDVVSQNQANGLFQVNIRAQVKRQQLLEKAKASNIALKPIDGTSLHGQLETQRKQEKDAKALLTNALLPLADISNFYRTELVPSTQEQPNPVVDKKASNEKFTTLNYKVYLWIDEIEYTKYVKSTLIPVLDQISITKEDVTRNYTKNGEEIRENNITMRNIPADSFVLGILTWKDKSFTNSRWRVFTVPDGAGGGQLEKIAKDFKKIAIELGLLDESKEIVALGNIKAECGDCSMIRSRSTGISLTDSRNQQVYVATIAPYFDKDGRHYKILPPKSEYFTVSVNIANEDLPRVKSAKLEIKPAGEN